MFISDPGNQLSNFEDVVNAFKKYENGGFWVKKIIQRVGVFRESVLGPYSHSEAEDIAKRWKQIFKFEGKEVAKVLDFKDLVCKKDTHLPIEDKLRWKPPTGARLFCLIHNYYPLVIQDDDIITDDDFLKFYYFTKPDGVRIKKTDGKLIIYNTNSQDSYRRAHIMIRFLERDADKYGEKEKNWLIDTIGGASSIPKEEHVKPGIIPGYINRINQDCSYVEIDFFKGEKSIGNVYQKIKRCAPDENKTFFFHNDVRYESVETDISISEVDKKLKRLVIEKSDDKKYNVLITNYEGNFSIGVYDINNGEGQMIIHLPDEYTNKIKKKETIFISDSLKKNKYLTRLDVIGSLLLYIVKCMGVKKVWLDDTLTTDCSCGALEISSFINPVRMLAGRGSIYSNLGFRNTEPEELEDLIEQYRDFKISISPEEKDKEDSEEDSDEDSDEEQEYMTLEELAIMYIEKSCTYQNLCDIMYTVTQEIHDRMPSRYELSLEEMDLGYYRGFF